MLSRGTVVLVSGFNEPAEHLRTLVEGRHGIPGLRTAGFECALVPRFDLPLRERIDRFAAIFEDELLRRDAPQPYHLVGYSLGGLVVRGFLRAHPERARDVRAIATIATPHWGLALSVLPTLSRYLRVPDPALADLTLDAPFMHWLNGTGGHWERVQGRRRSAWILDEEPWIAPDGVPLLAIVGLLPGREGDGLIPDDAATLGGRIPVHRLIGPTCNHFNLIGLPDLMLLSAVGVFGNDRVWPMTVRALLRWFGVKPVFQRERLAAV